MCNRAGSWCRLGYGHCPLAICSLVTILELEFMIYTISVMESAVASAEDVSV